MTEPIDQAALDAAHAEAEALFDEQVDVNVNRRERAYYRAWYIAGALDARFGHDELVAFTDGHPAAMRRNR